jgi:5'-nucleotidase
LKNIIFDMDEVLCQFLKKLVEESSCDTKIEDITQWELPESLYDTYKTPGFFRTLEPYPGMIGCFRSLYHNGYGVVIATNAQGIGYIVEDKLYWVRKHLPFFDVRNVIFTDRKELIRADAIIDDAPHYLEAFPGVKIVMDKPYNQHVQSDIRIYNNSAHELYRNIKRWGL